MITASYVFSISGLCNFIISPSTQIVTQGDTAIFTCQNSAADSVGWKINQTSIGRLEATTGITAESRVQPDGLLRILKIEGRPEYNASMVECVGFFIGGPSQSSQVVFLLIQGIVMNPSSHFLCSYSYSDNCNYWLNRYSGCSGLPFSYFCWEFLYLNYLGSSIQFKPHKYRA